MNLVYLILAIILFLLFTQKLEWCYKGDCSPIGIKITWSAPVEIKLKGGD